MPHLKQASPGASRGDQLFLSSQWMGLSHGTYCTLYVPPHTRTYPHSHSHTGLWRRARWTFFFSFKYKDKFVEGTVSFAWLGENTGTLGSASSRPWHWLRNTKRLGFIRTGVDPLSIDAVFMMIRKYSRKLPGREKEKKLSPPLSLWRKLLRPCRMTTLRIQQLSSNLWP